MWRGKKVSVIFPTYNEKDSIKASIEDFFSSGYVDEIVVVNNNAAKGTSEEVKKTRAKEVFEAKQGYGHAIRKGFEEAKGDLIVVSEPDGTFDGNDVIKLLAYSDDFDVVFGTRTTKDLIWKGANMGKFLRYGNYALAKLIEFAFNTSLLTDVGCTMRLIKRVALNRINHKFKVGSSYFGVEMMLLVITNNLKFFQIPVNYKERVGISSVTGDFFKAFVLGIQMTFFILNYRLKSLFGKV